MYEGAIVSYEFEAQLSVQNWDFQNQIQTCVFCNNSGIKLCWKPVILHDSNSRIVDSGEQCSKS